jgi:hypothetical protein
VNDDELPKWFRFLVTTAASTGLLKVKIFSRMKEKNINSPTGNDVSADNMSDDENFDLVSTPKTTIFEKGGMKLKMSLPPSTTTTPIASTLTPIVPAATPIASTLTPIASTLTPIASSLTPIASSLTPIASNLTTPIASVVTTLSSPSVTITPATPASAQSLLAEKNKASLGNVGVVIR